MKIMLDEAKNTELSSNEKIDEDLGDFIKKSILIGMLAIPGILEADDLKKISNLNQNSVAQISDSEVKIGGYTQAQAANIIARTLMAEGAGENAEGRKAIASVLWNRANEDSQNLVKVCFARKQFSCWNAAHPATNPDYNPDKYEIKLPSKLATNASKKSIWEECKKLASELTLGTFTSTIGNRNSYYNPSICSPAWGSDLKNPMTIGNHKFGYLPEQDPSRKKTNANKNSTIYVVKSGDSLSKIAKQNNTTVEKLQKLNGIKNADSIQVGQKIRLS